MTARRELASTNRLRSWTAHWTPCQPERSIRSSSRSPCRVRRVAAISTPCSPSRRRIRSRPPRAHGRLSLHRRGTPGRRQCSRRAPPSRPGRHDRAIRNPRSPPVPRRLSAPDAVLCSGEARKAGAGSGLSVSSRWTPLNAMPTSWRHIGQRRCPMPRPLVRCSFALRQKLVHATAGTLCRRKRSRCKGSARERSTARQVGHQVEHRKSLRPGGAGAPFGVRALS